MSLFHDSAGTMANGIGHFSSDDEASCNRHMRRLTAEMDLGMATFGGEAWSGMLELGRIGSEGLLPSLVCRQC